MSKHIQNINPNTLVSYFKHKRKCPKSPFLLSIDCDRTIVDRSKGSHFVSEQVVSMFAHLRKDPRFMVVINTGRDITNYQPIKNKIGHSAPCLFVSGRILHLNNDTYNLPGAEIPESFCRLIFEQLMLKAIPFLDAKSERGNCIFEIENQTMEKYYLLYKPIDWLEDVNINVKILRKKPANNFQNLKIVRFEIPIFKKDYPKLFKFIKNRNRQEVENLFTKLIGYENNDKLEFIPVPSHPSRMQLSEEVAYIRIMVNKSLVNKGTGIKNIINYLSIPESHVICFGDSAAETASDSAIKDVLPESTLLITEEGDEQALSRADFLIKTVGNNGVPEAISYLMN